MTNYFQLPDGVRVASNLPIDGDRYIASDISQRDLIVTNNRGFNGLQVYVESVKTLFLLEDVSVPTWVTLSTSTGGTFIESSPTEIIFNSGGTLTGSSNFTYDYNNSILNFKDTKSDLSIRTSYGLDPTILLKSNFTDGIELDIAGNGPLVVPVFSTIRSKGSQITKNNVVSDLLFISAHQGYHNLDPNSAVTGAQITVKAENWSANSYTSTYKISTVSSGNTSLDERLLIDVNGAIKFNDSYTFPQISGTSGQVLTQSGNGYLYWNDITATNTLSGLTDTIINNPQDGDKLIYSGSSWINVTDVDTVYQENIGSGGTYSFVIGSISNENAYFIHFMNQQNNTVFQMGELQLLHDGTDAQVTTNGQDLDLYVQYKAQIVGSDVILICDVPTLTGDVIMKYTKEIF